ncbi:MAG: murein hydrolase activator EnvC [Granulosicoccus sp.]
MPVTIRDHRWFRAWLTAVALLLASTVSAQQIQTIDDVQRRIADTAHRLQTLKAEIDRTRLTKREVESALANARTQLGEREQELHQLQEKIDRFDQQLSRLGKNVKDAEGLLQETRQDLAYTLRARQRIGRQPALRVLMQQNELAEAQRLQVYNSYVLSAQRSQILRQTDILARLDNAQTEINKERNWLNHVQRKANTQKTNSAREAEKNQSLLADIDRQIAQKTQTADQLRSSQQRLQGLLQELQNETLDKSDYFESRKGEFSLPVADGQIQARFGDLKDVGQLRWNGWFIEAAAGDKVSAVADGEILYSAWLQGFGLLVILDHGDGYMSLYGGNRSVLVQPGEWVESGATIATVGDSGGQKNSGLYFEIRHNANALDPESWFRHDES